jgi:hypothetical protein
VEHLTNDRLNSVKPKIPINELFPATSLVDISNAEFNMSKKSNICQPNSNSSSYNTMLENNAKLYIKILLNHSLEPEFIQRIRESNGKNPFIDLEVCLILRLG